MTQAPHAPQPSRKKALLSLLVLLALTGAIVFVFRDHWAEILDALRRLSLPQALLLLALALTTPLLDAAVTWVIARGRAPGFRYWQALDAIWTGTFCNVVTFGAGTLPMQTYYLHRCGLPAGQAVGTMTLEYAYHNTTVLLYATALLLAQRRWLTAASTGLLHYLPLAYLVVAVIVLALVLVCVSPAVQGLARWALRLLPKTETWQARRASWEQQLDILGVESRHLLADKPRCLAVLALHAGKLFLLFLVPYLSIRFMGLPAGLTLWQAQLLAALTFFLSNAMPNVAGMGSVETAFLLVFGSFLGEAGAMSALTLYRIATYYFTFALSAAGFWGMQRHMAKMAGKEL